MARQSGSQAEPHTFALSLSLKQGYEFGVDFRIPEVPGFTVDELAPLGAGHGPNPTRVLAAAVGHCLGSSLLFCLRKGGVEPSGLGVDVTGTMVRNERGRLRIGRLTVRLTPAAGEADSASMTRCLEVFEDFCIVTGSVRQGIDVRVEVVGRP